MRGVGCQPRRVFNGPALAFRNDAAVKNPESWQRPGHKEGVTEETGRNGRDTCLLSWSRRLQIIHQAS